MIVSTESNCCISPSLRAACFVGWRPSPLRAACGASLRLESVRLTCLERFVAQERANRLVLTSVGFNCFPLCKKVFKTRLENCGPRAHALLSHGDLPLCFVSSGDRQLLSPFLLGRSLGELSHTGGSSHFPQSPGLCSDHSRHLRPNSAPLPSPAAAGGPRNWSTSPFLGPAGRVSRAQQSCVAGGSDRLHHPGRLWGCAWPWRPACIRPASGPVSVAPPPAACGRRSPRALLFTRRALPDRIVRTEP